MLEAKPALTSLGETLDEATKFLKTHEDVISKIQSKQSPTEELLRKADHLIASQRPRAEVYAAMAESLGQAWEDVNKHLMRRRDILLLNVSYQSRAKIYFERVRALELLCSGSPITSNVELIRENLESLQEVKRAMLESLMSTLQEGEVLLATLRSVANENTDSRPDETKSSTLLAISQVEHWLEQLHDQRRTIETIWSRRRTLLEQSLALSLLATDLALLESLLFDRHESLNSTINHLGHSETETKVILENHQTLKPEAKELQDQSLKVLRAAEQLLMGGHLGDTNSTTRGYNILQSSAEYIQHIEDHEELLNSTIKFFSSAKKVFADLDKLQVEIDDQRRIDSAIVTNLNSATQEVIDHGRTILNVAPGAKGVKKTVEDLENRKVNLNMCYQEEYIKFSEILNSFLERQNELYSWLINDPEEFIKANKNVGNNEIVSKSLLASHLNLLKDMQEKGCEINSLLSSLPNDFTAKLNNEERIDVTSKIEELHKLWVHLKNILDQRVSFISIFIEVCSNIQLVSNEFDSVEEDLRTDKILSDSEYQMLKEYWSKAYNHYQELLEVKKDFIKEADKAVDIYLNVDHAQQHIVTLIKQLSNRKSELETLFSSVGTRILEHKKRIGELWQQNMADSLKTMDWVSKLDAQLYPVLNDEATSASALITEIENKLNVVLPEVKRAQTEIEARIKTAETLVGKGEAQDAVPPRLCELNQKLLTIITEYQSLAETLIKFFKNLSQLEDAVMESETSYNTDNVENNLNVVDLSLNDHDELKQTISEHFRQSYSESVQIINKIKSQEPESARERDIACIRRLLDMKRSDWERNWAEYKCKLEQKQQLCQFDTDLANINHHLDDLSKQLITIRGQYGESLSSAKSTSLAFLYFEKTVQLLEQRIETFIAAAEAMLNSDQSHAEHVSQELLNLKKSREAFLEEVNKSRHLIDLSIQYFQLVEEAQGWFQEGSKLLVMIVHKSSKVQNLDEINLLLEQIELFLKPQEAQQEQRIDKISQLSLQLFGTEKPVTVEQVVNDSQELMESFSSVCKELETLSETLKRKEEETNMDLDESAPKIVTIENKPVDAVEEKDILAKDVLLEAVPVQETNDNDRKSPSPPPPFKKAKLTEEDEWEPPAFVAPLFPATVSEGEKYTLKCTVSGKPSPQITWLKDNLSIENNPDYVTKFEDGVCTLTIEETFAEDSALFTCVATNERGSVSTSAILSVTECISEEHVSGPEFVKPLKDLVLNEGDQLELLCEVEGNPLPTVQWFKNDSCIDNSPDFLISYNNGEAVLRVEKASKSDEGKYCCKASNPTGTSFSTATLTVESIIDNKIEGCAPEFVSPLSNVMGRAGQKIKLECEISGDPKPELAWTHNEKPISETRDIQFFHDGDKVGLIINEAFPKDAGIYKLVVKNELGEASSSCSAAVKGIPPVETSDSEHASDSELVKPVVKMPLKDLTASEGEKAQLDCIIVAQPEPEVIWYFEGQPVKESTDLQLIFAGDRCSLILNSACPEDSGQYEVIAINSAGETSSSCALTVESRNIENTEEPPAPETEKIEKIEKNETIEKKIKEAVLPKFDNLLEDILTREGESACLECSVSGEPVPFVKWLLNNVEIEPSDRIVVSDDLEGNHKLEILVVKPEDRGVYTVKASNSLGEVKCFSHLIVKENSTLESKPSTDVQLEEKLTLPSFSELFSDTTAFIADSIKFECIVFGKPTPKIKWYFNDQPVSGSNFLVSTSGDRQVLAIPEVSMESQGKISCVAENEVGKSSCDAILTVKDIGRRLEMFPPPSQNIDTSSESYSYQMKRSVFSESSSVDGCAPTRQVQSYKSLSENAMQQIGSQPPLQMESLETEEYKNINGIESHHQSLKSSSNISGIIEKHESHQTSNVPPNFSSFPKPIRKQTSPRFISTLMGKIVDQGTDVVLEGIIESYPPPVISWSKNGVDIYPIPGKLSLNWQLNKASLEIRNVTTQDSGRYTCKAENALGSATCTADIVVKKSVFSPIVGRRLQSQTVPTNERVILEVEVTGQPEPTVTWYKDNQEIPRSSGMYRFRSQGNSHALIIDKVTLSHGGQYTVRMKNEAGESNSTATIYVFEPPPSQTQPHQTSKEIDIETKFSGDWAVPDSNVLSAKWSPGVNTEHSQTISEQHHEESKSSDKLSESIFVSETIKTDKHVVIKLGNDVASSSPAIIPFSNFSSHLSTNSLSSFPEPAPAEKKETPLVGTKDETSVEEQSITKRSALDFFKNIIKENEAGTVPDKTSETIKTIFSEPRKEPESIPEPYQKPVGFSSSVPVLTSLPSPYVSSKTYESSFSESSSVTKHLKSIEPFSQSELFLEPGPPPEMGFIPKVAAPKQKPDMLSRVKKLEESQRELSPIEIPSGGVKIFPMINRKNSFESRQQVPVSPAPPLQPSAAPVPQPLATPAPAFPESIGKTYGTECERKEVYEDTIIKKKVEFTGSQDSSFVKNVYPTQFVSVPHSQEPNQPTQDKPIMRPQAENITLRPLSPRPSAEGVSMEKLWSSRQKEESTTILGEPIQRASSPLPAAFNISQPATSANYSSPIRKVIPPVSTFTPQPQKVASPTPPFFSPQPRRVASPPPALSYPSTQRVSSPLPSFLSSQSQMSASWYGSDIKRATSPRPSAEGVAMEKLWSKPTNVTTSFVKPSSPVTPKTTPVSEPKPQVVSKPLKKTWPPAKTTDEEVSTPWTSRVVEQSSTTEAIPGGYHYESKDYSSEQTKTCSTPVQNSVLKPATPFSSSSIEKREMTSYSSYSSSQVLSSNQSDSQSAFQPFHNTFPAVIEENIIKPSEIKKVWPPGNKFSEPAPFPKNVSPKSQKFPQASSVTDVSAGELHLVPGPPPEMAYAEPPSVSQRQSYVKSIEEGLEKNFEKGSNKLLPSSFRTTPTLPNSHKEIFSSEFSQDNKKSNFNMSSSYHFESSSKNYNESASEQKKVSPPWATPTKRPLSVEIPHNGYQFSSPTRQSRPVSCQFDSYSESSFSEQQYKSGYAPPHSNAPLDYSSTFTEVSKTESVKPKPKVFQRESGYMADTDEPRLLLKETGFSESTNWQRKKYATLPASTKALNKKGATPFKQGAEKSVKLQDLSPQPFPFQPDPPKPAVKQIGPPPRSPSKFVKGEFRESDYESDFESVRIPAIWKPFDSDTEDVSYRPVRPNLTPVSHRKKYDSTSSIPSEFDKPPRPKFEPFEKSTPVKLKEILSPTRIQSLPRPFPQSSQTESQSSSLLMMKPISPPKVHYTSPPSTYSASSKLGPTVETSNAVSFSEATETCKRFVNVEQTTKVYNYENTYGSETRSHTPSQYSQIQSNATPFHVEPSFIKAEQKRLERVEQMRKRFESNNDIVLQPGEPPEFVIASPKLPSTSPSLEVKTQMNGLTNRFKSKVQKFASDVMTDVNSKKEIVGQSSTHPTTSDTQGYREESRLAEYGTKQIDPTTGLIYFKYDFGYEFGVVMPNDNATINDKKNDEIKPKVKKSVKWDPASESDISEGEERKRSCLKQTAIVPYKPSQSQFSPNLSLPSRRVDQHRSLAGSSWTERLGAESPSQVTPVNAGSNRHDIQKPPFFITPLRDIAVVKGRSARFECIVQGEPTPKIVWLRDTAIIESSDQFDIQFRNGVCRLTIPQAYSYNAGLYRCCANNILGSADTSATLTVSGENRSRF